jgi:hypothetical protein
MGRRVFYSFHYQADNWRTSQVRNAGFVEGSRELSPNDWETVTRGGDAAIQRWIDDQMNGRSCAVVLIGSNTAGRKWIDYEIIKAWNDRKGVVGVHIHNLKDSNGNQSYKGANPFTGITLGTSGTPLSNVAKVYDPPSWQSTDVYNYIAANLGTWVDEAIQIRNSK